MTTPALPSRSADWSGKSFGAPRPRLLTRSWRVKKGILRPLDLKYAASALLAGQDSTNAAACTKGLPVYAGYYNGTFANLNSFRSLFPNAVILSITPNGVKGARCIDCEPGDATVAGAANFVAANLPVAGAGGRNDGGKPMVYCSAGDSQAVINAIAAKGISRSQWILWSAHWIGQHICSPSACNYPAADATQYASNNSFDIDEFYSYCFGATPPASEWPLAQGSVFTADVATLQKNINKWITALAGAFGATVLLTADGSYGPLTVAAVKVAQLYFGQAPTGTCSQSLFNALAAPAVSPWPLKQGSSGPLVTAVQTRLNAWKFGVLTADGLYGPVTASTVAKAQAYFKNGAPAGQCDQSLAADLASAPPAPPAPPWTYRPPTALKVLGAGPHSVKFQFSALPQAHGGLAKFQVVLCKGDRLTVNVPTYPRYVEYSAPGIYNQQWGGVQPATGYIMGVRGMAQDGTHASPWVLVRFTTAKA